MIIGGIIFFNINHDYVLIHSDYSNKAIKIERKLTIWNLSQMLRLNLDFGHACGYHTTIKMIDNHEITSKIPFNVECEEFIRASESINRDIRAYYQQLQENPTHKIYNLIIPIGYDIDSILDILDKKRIEYVMLDGKLNQFPEIEISTMQISKLSETQDREQWNVEEKENEKLAYQKIEGIVKRIKEKYSVENVSDISSPMSGFGATIEHEKAVKIHFKIGTDLSTIKEFVESIDGEIERMNIPMKFWIPILIDNKENINDKIKGLDFVIDMKEYPDNE